MACIIAHLYGAQKTTPASVLQFPYPEAAAESNVFYDDEGWPLGKIDNKDQKLFRFDFLDPEGAKSKRNKSQFDILVKYFQQHGKGWNVAYKDYIQSLSVPEVEKIAVYKFKHYAKAEKDRMKPKVPSEDTDGSTTQTQLSRAAAVSNEYAFRSVLLLMAATELDADGEKAEGITGVFRLEPSQVRRRLFCPLHAPLREGYWRPRELENGVPYADPVFLESNCECFAALPDRKAIVLIGALAASRTAPCFPQYPRSGSRSCCQHQGREVMGRRPYRR